MQTISKTYLQLVPFSNLLNWSVQYMLETKIRYTEKYPLVELGEFLKRNKTAVDVEDTNDYKRVTIKTNNGGVYLRNIEKGKNIGTKKQFIISEGQFLLSKIDARNGAFGVVTKETDGAIITGNFWTFDVDYKIVNPHFLSLITTTPEFIKFSENASNGTTNRHYLQEKLFLSQKIPIPSLLEQNQLVKNYNTKISKAEKLEKQALALEEGIEKYLFVKLGIEENRFDADDRFLSFIQFRLIREWGIDKIKNNNRLKSIKYDLLCFEEQDSLYKEMLRGKSPKYIDRSDKYILNQKCNRWGAIDIQYAKTVDSQWIGGLDKEQFTKEGDVLINSTGEGTIGRSTVITNEYVNLMYDSHILLLRVEERKINPLYFSLLFNSSFGQKQVNSLKSAQSTKQTELGIGNLKKFRFPLPPISIQKEISNHIREIMDNVKLLRKEAEATRKNAIIEFEKEIFE